MNRWLILAALILFVVVYRLLLRIAIKKLSSVPESRARHNSRVLHLNKAQEKVYTKWLEDGNLRRAQKPEYILPEESSEESDKTEVANTFEELFDGLSEEEVSDILDEVLSEEKDGSANG